MLKTVVWIRAHCRRAETQCSEKEGATIQIGVGVSARTEEGELGFDRRQAFYFLFCFVFCLVAVEHRIRDTTMSKAGTATRLILYWLFLRLYPQRVRGR